METAQTLSAVIQTLRKKGYDIDFHFGFNGIFSYKENLTLIPGEFDIDEVYHFCSKTDLSDEAFVYAINCGGRPKGILVDNFGTSAGPLSESMERKFCLKTHEKEQSSFLYRASDFSNYIRNDT